MKTDEEIIARIEKIKKQDFFGWETTDLIFKLPFAKAKEYLKPEATEEEYKQEPRDRDSVIAAMLDYMPFAWDKANNCRGISAGRSICHFSAWTWLAGDDLGDLHGYKYYGKDELVKICEQYGWDSKQWDNGIRANDEEDDWNQRSKKGS